MAIRRLDSGTPLEYRDTTFVFKTAIGNSGIRFKVDPGVPLVYAGFLITILATLLSFKDHEQVWAY